MSIQSGPMNLNQIQQIEPVKSHATDQTAPRSSTPISPNSPPLPPIVYGELSILGYNGYIPNSERSGRRNKSKYLLCKRPQPNGIKKSRHYIVKQPQATRAIQDKDLHSISYTFSRSQTIIVEYKQDENTDMFQIGRSSENQIDFVVMDTLPAGRSNLNETPGPSGSAHQHGRHSGGRQHSSTANAPPAASSSNNYPPPHYPNHYQHHLHHNENASSSNQQLIAGDPLGVNRFHRHMAKVGEEMLQFGFPPNIHEYREDRYQIHSSHGQSVLVNFPPPNITNLPPMIANHFRYQDLPMFHQPHVHGSGSQQHQQLIAQAGSNHLTASGVNSHSNQRDHRHQQNGGSRHNSDNLMSKRSHTTQSTISRFACRVLVDREPPYTARIYAAGFDSSKNIFLGEKATKWEQNNSIDGLTTNGVLLMHPKRGFFHEITDKQEKQVQDHEAMDIESDNEADAKVSKTSCSNKSSQGFSEGVLADQESKMNKSSGSNNNSNRNNDTTKSQNKTSGNDDSNNNNNSSNNNNNSSNNNNNNKLSLTKGRGTDFEYGGIWREVSVDGGIYAIRESRSAVQKGRRIESETNILQDGTLIDLCGATLLWRSLDGFKSSPTKKTLEEKIDMLNASRPQCPVGLNTLVIPRKPILPNGGHRSGHHRKDHYGNKDGLYDDKSGHQPYVYLKCGHVQGYHDWGATAKSNQRTCPICLSVGNVAKLSMGLEPSFYVDSGPLTHVFNPCGHMASERTVKYWCSINIPHGTHFFHSICPFCATPLASDGAASTKLIFQEDLD